jgi:hypothetical protein
VFDGDVKRHTVGCTTDGFTKTTRNKAPAPLVGTASSHERL